MDSLQLVEYMRAHGFAEIGNPDTLEAAQALEKQGVVVKVGDNPETKRPVYRLSAKAIAQMNQKQQKSLLRKGIDALIDYKTAMEDGASSSDLDKASSLTFGSSDLDLLAAGGSQGKKEEKKQ